ncbi:MAG: VWA domain-containing protein [Bacilli bacterium]|nr:VWA domain-containing protein [Bacilli bacterium]
MANQYFGDDDLITNTSARIPVCLCVDVSGSMYDLLPRVNEGIRELYEALAKEDATKDSVEVCVVDFSDDARVVRDFETVVGTSAPKVGPVRGCTDLAAGINTCLDLLDQRKDMYKQNHLDYYQPHLVVFSDGEPTSAYESARSRVQSLVSARKLTFLPIVLGEDAQRAAGVLREFSEKPPIKAVDIVGFFQWYSKSLATIGVSNPGDKVKMDTEGIKKWGEW